MGVQVSSISCFQTATHKRMKPDPYLTPYAKINSKWIDLNVQPEIRKLPGENIRVKLLDISLGNDFLDLTPKAKATKAKIEDPLLRPTF